MLKVLIVEDEEVIRYGLMLTINWVDMGCYVVGSAQDGVEGLQMIKELSPDIVLTDIKMPRMNGLQMIKEAANYYSFKIIILTSYSEFDFAKRAIGLKVSDYLLKPVDERMLRDVIERIYRDLDMTPNISENDKKVSALTELERSGVVFNSNAIQSVYVIKAVEKIIENYREKNSIEMIAEELGVSGSYLSRKFKESFGKSYLDVLNQYRIQQSIRLLSEGTYRIYEVSYMCGFNDYKHFCNVFKKYMSIAPSQYLKNLSHAAYQNAANKQEPYNEISPKNP